MTSEKTETRRRYSAAMKAQVVAAARLNGHEPYAYLKDVLQRLPTQLASAIADLVPYRRARLA